MGIKIAVIGGGSTYTPELVEGLGRRRDVLPVDELVLHDIDADAPGGRRRPRPADPRPRTAGPGRLSPPTDRDAAIDGASFVLVQLRVGGMARAPARRDDPAASSAASARRRRGRAASPRRCAPSPSCSTSPTTCGASARPAPGWSTSPTPSGLVTQALLDHGHRAIGLCNVPIGFQREFAERLGVAPERVQLDHVGLNHLSLGAQGAGRRRRPPARAARASTPTSSPPRSSCRSRSSALQRAVPSYYLRYYYATSEVLAELRAATAPRRGGDGDRARPARDVRRPGARGEARSCSRSAAAPSTPRRRRC